MDATHFNLRPSTACTGGRLMSALRKLRPWNILLGPWNTYRPVERSLPLGNTWRLRVGDYRGIYVVEPGKVTFTRFGHRSDIYHV